MQDIIWKIGVCALVGWKIISSSQGDKALSEFILRCMNLASQKKDWVLKNSTDMSSDWMNSL